MLQNKKFGELRSRSYRYNFLVPGRKSSNIKQHGNNSLCLHFETVILGKFETILVVRSRENSRNLNNLLSLIVAVSTDHVS